MKRKQFLASLAAIAIAPSLLTSKKVVATKPISPVEQKTYYNIRFSFRVKSVEIHDHSAEIYLHENDHRDNGMESTPLIGNMIINEKKQTFLVCSTDKIIPYKHKIIIKSLYQNQEINIKSGDLLVVYQNACKENGRAV